MGGVANTAGRIGSGIFTLGGSEIARNNLGAKSPLSQLLQAPGTILTGGASAAANMPCLFGGSSNANPIPGPFSLDPAQLAADQSAIGQMGTQQGQAITGLGEKQFGDTSQFIAGDQSSRAAARAQMGQALTKQANDTFQYMLPQTEEKLNSQHLLNGSGLGLEIGRQQGQIAKDITNQLGVLGAGDIDLASQQRAAALQSLQGTQQAGLGTTQGFQTGGLQRGLSLEDFINQANVAKTIGAQMAPQPPSSKAQAGSTLQGVGAMAPWFAKGGAMGK